MPTGPGEDILDAIESGAADDVLILKFHVKPEEIKAFRSLHYGLSNQKMKFDEIGEYYPELNTYFKPAAPLARYKPTAKDLAPPAPIPKPVPGDTEASRANINKALFVNDDVIDYMIREGRYQADARRRQDELAAGPRSDMPVTAQLAMQRLQLPEQETRPQDLPVTPDELLTKKSEIHQDEQQARHMLSQVIARKPEQAAAIQKSLYNLDAAARTDGNEAAIAKVNANLEKLGKGELKYDPKTSRLIEEEGFFDALVTGVKERNKQLNDFDEFQKDDTELISILEKRLQDYDPDQPQKVPKGAGEISQMVGTEWKSLLHGALIGGTVGRVAPQAAPWLTAAANAPEYFRRAYSSTLEQTYNQLRRDGKTPEEALQIAKSQARDEGLLDMAEGAISSAIGGRMGLKALPKFNVTGSFKNAAANVLKHTTHYAVDQTIDGLADGLVAGYLQDQKNIAAGEKGIFRTEGEGVKDAIKGELTFALALGGITKAASATVDPKVRNKLLYWLGKQPSETVEAKMADMVLSGELTEEQASEAKLEIEEQKKLDGKIPEDIKDVSRQAMAEKIKRRQELETQIENVDEALHPPLKEEIKKLNDEILEHSTHKKPDSDNEEQEIVAEATEAADAPAELPVQEPGAEQTGLEDQPVPASNDLQPTEGIQSNQPASADAAQVEIKTEEDLDAALQNALSKFQQQPEKAPDNEAPLPKLAGNTTQAKPLEEDVTVYTPTSILQRAKETFKGNPLVDRVVNFLTPLVESNPNIRIDHKTSVPDNVYGYSHSDGRIELNFNNHADEAALLQTGMHELMHAVTRSEIENNQAFRSELTDMLTKVRGKMSLPDSDAGVTTALHLLSAAGKLDENTYGAANVHEMIAELFTNQNFRDQLAEIKYEGDSLLKKIFQLIAKFLSDKYKQVVGAKAEISADNVADYLMQLTERVVTTQSQSDSAGALASKAPPSKEEALLGVIKSTPKSISDEVLRNRIVALTGMDAGAVQKLIDSVRKPPIPPPPTTKTGDLSDGQKSVSLNKFDKLFEQHKEKKPSWFSRQWEGLKNASAKLDNPYRFITKLTEDIRRAYGLQNTASIPLGRVFEKSAAGRAALKVQSFVKEVVLGNINGKKYGRLKGEKYNDFQKYLAAKRVIDRLNKQEELRRGGEDSSRQTGNITRQDAAVLLDHLASKYGNLDEFDTRAKAFQQHMDDMLMNLVGSGILSKEQYDNIKKENDFYAPFSVVQEKLRAGMEKQPVGISGIVKRIKGIDYNLPATQNDALETINDLSEALRENKISPEDYFNGAVEVLQDALNNGLLTTEEYQQEIASLANPGFALNDILDAAANMIYKSEGMALQNRNLQRLYSYKQYDTKGEFIQDVDAMEPVTIKGGEIRMVPKPLDEIKVAPGMAPIRLKIDGKDKVIAVSKMVAEKLTTMSNYETATWMKALDVLNKLFRAVVITLSPGFQVVNFAIDFVRSSMLSRYGPIAGKGLVEPVVNAALFVPQYIEALLHSALGNVGIKTEAYKQWMESDSFSKGMFDNLFDNEKKIKEVSASLAKRLLENFLKLKFIDTPGAALEQTHKLATYQRGLAVEGFEPKMFTAMLSAIFNKTVSAKMTTEEVQEASDRLNYEVQNFAGSPNFPQTHKWMKVASVFLQFFSARVKGEMTDYRRIANLFSGKGEGVALKKQEAIQIGLQFASMASALAAYAIINNLDDKDEEEFNGVPPYHRDNYMNIPAGTFEYKDSDGNTQILRDYIKIPLRGLTATMNVMSNSFVKFYKRQNPEEFKKMAEAFLGNASPINLSGNNERELGESSISNLTPVFKFFIEYSFNRDTHSHRDIIPDTHGARSMLSQYTRGDLKPYEVYVDKTPEWAKEMSRYLYEEMGISINPITLDHMENTMGNPTELYDNAIEKRLLRSKMKFPLYVPKGPRETRSAEVKPVND